MVFREQLEQMSKWAGIVGIVTIIGGVIQAITGVFAFIIGAIPGIIAIILGVKLRNAKKYADQILASDGDTYEDTMKILLENLNSYFKIQGILMIVGIVMSLLGVITALTMSASMLGGF